MKKLLMIAALASLSSPAFASKARVSALGNADHLVDAQTAFDNPSHIALLPDYVTFEAGPTAAAAPALNDPWSEVGTAPTAEGGFTQSSGDAKWGAYLGRRSPFTQTMRTNFGFLGQENPIEIQYAMKGATTWGVAFNYSSADQKSTSSKQQAMGVRVGATTDMWEAFGIFGLGSTADGIGAAGNALLGDVDGDGVVSAGDIQAYVADPDAKYKGTTGFKIGGAYKMDNIRVYAKYYMDGFKMETPANAALDDSKFEQSQLDVGVLDITKLDAGSWFYGVAYQMFTSKSEITAGESKTTASYLPFIAGIEYDAASWIALRGSVSQNVLIGSEKSETGGVGESDTVANNTKVAAGIGLKFNKWSVDGSWAAATTGTVNTTALMTNLGLTYNF